MNAACEHSYLMDEETCFRVIKEIIQPNIKEKRQTPKTLCFRGLPYILKFKAVCERYVKPK
jgi:hypothetical protein